MDKLLQHYDLVRLFPINRLSDRFRSIWRSRGVGMVSFELGMFLTVCWFDFSARRAKCCRILSIYCMPSGPTAQGTNEKPPNKKSRGGALAARNFLAQGRPEAGISENQLLVALGRRRSRQNIKKQVFCSSLRFTARTWTFKIRTPSQNAQTA